MDDISKTYQKKNGLSLACNILAGVLCLISVAVVIITLTSSQSVMNNQIFFQLAGLQDLSALILKPLQMILINAGIVLAIVTLIFAFIFYLAGRIISRQSSLQERVRLLEEKYS